MLLSEIIADVRSQINEPEAVNSHVSDSELISWANECTEQLCSLIHTYRKVTYNPVCAATISLSESLISVDYASVVDPNGKHINLKVIDFDNFVRYYPSWEDNAADIPKWLVRTTETDYMLYPTPSSAYLGAAMTVMGRSIPAAMTSASDTPPVHKVLHPAYIHYLAWKCFARLNQPDRSNAAFQMYDIIRQRNMRSATQTIPGGLRWRVMGS